MTRGTVRGLVYCILHIFKNIQLAHCKRFKFNKWGKIQIMLYWQSQYQNYDFNIQKTIPYNVQKKLQTEILKQP